MQSFQWQHQHEYKKHETKVQENCKRLSGYVYPEYLTLNMLCQITQPLTKQLTKKCF